MTTDIFVHNKVLDVLKKKRDRKRKKVRRSIPVRLKVYGEWFVGNSSKTAWHSEKLACPAGKPYGCNGAFYNWAEMDSIQQRVLEEIKKNTQVVQISYQEYYELT